jgi:hypothetical protein
MVALTELVGPQGVRLVDSALLRLISGSVTTMKAILQSNRGPLVAIQQSACTAAGALESAKSFALGISNTTAPPWLQCCTAMTGLSHLLQMAINVGNALSLRKMLREGQKRVTKKRIPLLAACARIAQGQYPENLGAVAECLPVDCMALDCGETSPATDHALKIALAHLKTDADDAELWRLLPFALAATFTDPVWKAKDVEYLVKVCLLNISVYVQSMFSLCSV